MTDEPDVERNVVLGELAEQLWTARRERRLLDVDHVVGRRGGGWSMAEGYVVQEMLMQRRRDRGEREIGWKLGYTSLAMRRQMGLL